MSKGAPSQFQKDVLRTLEHLGIETKANEAVNTTQAATGGNFVPTIMSQNIVKKARLTSKIMSSLPAENIITMPSNPYTHPVEGADMSWNLTSEQTDYPATEVTKSTPGTGLMTFNAKKLSASVVISAEEDEDALVQGGIMGYIENKFAASYAELIEKLIINGDTRTSNSTNVNAIDGDPVAASYFLAQDGLVRNAQANSTTLDVGTLDSGDFRAVRKLLGKKGADPSKLLCIPTLETYFKMLSIAQVETMEKYGASATIVNGVLEHIDGMLVSANPDFLLGQSGGYRGTSSNTLGRFLVAYMPEIFVGFKREMKMVVEYYGKTDQYILTAHVRVAVQCANTSSLGTAAMGYNITV